MFGRKNIFYMPAAIVLAAALAGCSVPGTSDGREMPGEETAGGQDITEEGIASGQEMTEEGIAGGWEISGEGSVSGRETTGEGIASGRETVGEGIASGQVTMREDGSAAQAYSEEESHAGETPEESGGEEPNAETDIGSTEPELPVTGTQLSDFVAEGWEILDCVELDFNQDGIVDYVGVQEVPLDKEKDEWWNDLSLRVLFAIASEGQGQYRLDFQDANLIRARTEGGMMGDPFDGIEGEGTSFTTHAEGGSSDKWSESFTYTYRDGTWYLTASEICNGYCWNVDDYRRDDWDSGIRVHKTRGRTVNCCHGEYVFDPGVYELEYEMRLAEPFTIQQASARWWLTQYRATDWEVRDIVRAEGIELPEDRIRKPDNAYYDSGCMDEKYMIYTFGDKENGKEYLALYNRPDRVLSVLAVEEYVADSFGRMEALGIYEEKIYYAIGVKEPIRFWSKYKDRVIDGEDVVGQRVVRMNLDGTEKETIFTYRYPGTNQPVLEEEPPYMSISDFSVSGGEIVLEVYISDEDHPWYRMYTDGSKQRKIGQVSEEFPWEENEEEGSP